MRSSLDVLRSTKRWTALLLPTYEVRLDSQIVGHPMAVISQTTPITHGGRRFVADLSMGMRIAVYPGPQETEEAAVMAAGGVENTLFMGLRRSVEGSHSLRIPLFDYDGVGADAAASSGARDAWDFIRVSALNVQPLYEPEDRKRVTVLCAFTATWFRAGEQPEIESGALNTGGVVIDGA